MLWRDARVPCSGSFHPRKRPSEVKAVPFSRVLVPSPRYATPTLPVLALLAWAPMTGW